MSGEGVLHGARDDRRPAPRSGHDLEQPLVRIPGYLLDELKPYAAKRQISVMRMVRVLLREVVVADLVDDVAGAAR